MFFLFADGKAMEFTMEEMTVLFQGDSVTDC